MGVKVTTQPEAMAANWRVAMFGIINMYLTTHHAFTDTGEPLTPSELLIYLTVGVANVQKLMRERDIPGEFAATAVLPREWVVPISRNAIAAATDLPRETVRRQVERLIQRGLLIEDVRGGVTPPPGIIETLGVQPMLEPLLTEFARTTEHMLRIGVITIQND